MKPIRPIDSYYDVIYFLTLISIFIRLCSITFVFLLIYFTSLYKKTIKDAVLNSVSGSNLNNNKYKIVEIWINDNIQNIKFLINEDINPGEHSKNREIRNNEITSVNNYESNYTANSCEDKNFIEETSIRVNMDELNEKIKAGEIFTDSKCSTASNINTYNLII